MFKKIKQKLRLSKVILSPKMSDEEINKELEKLVEDGFLTRRLKGNQWEYELTKKGEKAKDILFGKI